MKNAGPGFELTRQESEAKWNWNSGIMEQWNDGLAAKNILILNGSVAPDLLLLTHYSNMPSFQYREVGFAPQSVDRPRFDLHSGPTHLSSGRAVWHKMDGYL